MQSGRGANQVIGSHSVRGVPVVPSLPRWRALTPPQLVTAELGLEPQAGPPLALSFQPLGRATAVSGQFRVRIAPCLIRVNFGQFCWYGQRNGKTSLESKTDTLICDQVG